RGMAYETAPAPRRSLRGEVVLAVLRVAEREHDADARAIRVPAVQQAGADRAVVALRAQDGHRLAIAQSMIAREVSEASGLAVHGDRVRIVRIGRLRDQRRAEARSLVRSGDGPAPQLEQLSLAVRLPDDPDERVLGQRREASARGSRAPAQA